MSDRMRFIKKPSKTNGISTFLCFRHFIKNDDVEKNDVLVQGKIVQKALVFLGFLEGRDFLTSPTSGSKIDGFWTSKVAKLGALELKIGVQNR